MSETATPAKKQQSSAMGCALLVGLLVGGFFGVKSCLSDSSGSYEATVGDFVAMNPSDLAVTLHVKNTGSSAGTPQCEVDAHDPSYTYTGVDIGSLTDPVQPGDTTTAVMHLSISKDGASYVTDVTVKCS